MKTSKVKNDVFRKVKMQEKGREDTKYNKKPRRL